MEKCGFIIRMAVGGAVGRAGRNFEGRCRDFTVTVLALGLFSGGMHAAAVVRGSQVRAFGRSGTTTYWIQALGGKPLSAYAVTYGFVKKGGKKEFAFCVLQYQTMPKLVRYAVRVIHPYDPALGRAVTQATLRLPSGRFVELPWYWPLVEITDGRDSSATITAHAPLT
ncbi:MAG TPA: hypothetical protein VFA18_24970 [Gemmataceae bacterium]|nr:hypothetical protein [Gemmataceae bacterium]